MTGRRCAGRRSSARRATRREQLRPSWAVREVLLAASVGVHDVDAAPLRLRRRSSARRVTRQGVGVPARVSSRFPLPSAFTTKSPPDLAVPKRTGVLMKAILERRRCGGNARSAANAGDAVSGLRRALEGREDRDPDQRHERHERRVDAPPTPGALSRLLDQRLDEGLDLLAIDGIARTRRARRSGNGHGCLPDSVALVLLASC